MTAGTVLTAQPTREVARRAWPMWLALGVAMVAVAGASIAWSDGGARLLLGALGLFLAVRGGALLRVLLRAAAEMRCILIVHARLYRHLGSSVRHANVFGYLLSHSNPPVHFSDLWPLGARPSAQATARR